MKTITTASKRARLRRYAAGSANADWELVVDVLDDFAQLEADHAAALEELERLRAENKNT